MAHTKTTKVVFYFLFLFLILFFNFIFLFFVIFCVCLFSITKTRETGRSKILATSFIVIEHEICIKKFTGGVHLHQRTDNN
jgi:hypothetical protein